MDASNVVALVVAGVSAVVAVAGIVLERASRDKALQTQRDELELAERRWREQFSLDLAKARAELTQGLYIAEYEHRAATFAPVFATLGVVRDVPDPVKQEHWRELEGNRDALLKTADELLTHLYGAPGLFMHYDTRNRILRAYEACFQFQAGRIDLTELVDAFFFARRYLREDLNLTDGRARVRLEDKLRDVKPPSVS